MLTGRAETENVIKVNCSFNAPHFAAFVPIKVKAIEKVKPWMKRNMAIA